MRQKNTKETKMRLKRELEEERELKEKRMTDDHNYHKYGFYPSSPRGGATSRQKMAHNHGDIH
jgi:hypothetical protein